MIRTMVHTYLHYSHSTFPFRFSNVQLRKPRDDVRKTLLLCRVATCCHSISGSFALLATSPSKRVNTIRRPNQ